MITRHNSRGAHAGRRRAPATEARQPVIEQVRDMVHPRRKTWQTSDIRPYAASLAVGAVLFAVLLAARVIAVLATR